MKALQEKSLKSLHEQATDLVDTFKGPGISAVEPAPLPNRNTMDVDDGMYEENSDAGNGDGTDYSQVSSDSLTSSDPQRPESDSDEMPRTSKRRRR